METYKGDAINSIPGREIGVHLCNQTQNIFVENQITLNQTDMTQKSQIDTVRTLKYNSENKDKICMYLT